MRIRRVVFISGRLDWTDQYCSGGVQQAGLKTIHRYKNLHPLAPLFKTSHSLISLSLRIDSCGLRPIL